jgi:hypothetical protein
MGAALVVVFVTVAASHHHHHHHHTRRDENFITMVVGLFADLVCIKGIKDVVTEQAGAVCRCSLARLRTHRCEGRSIFFFSLVRLD